MQENGESNLKVTSARGPKFYLMSVDSNFVDFWIFKGTVQTNLGGQSGGRDQNWRAQGCETFRSQGLFLNIRFWAFSLIFLSFFVEKSFKKFIYLLIFFLYNFLYFLLICAFSLNFEKSISPLVLVVHPCSCGASFQNQWDPEGVPRHRDRSAEVASTQNLNLPIFR